MARNERDDMSINLHLSNGVKNRKNKRKPMYEEFPLRQTPTEVTLFLIGLGNNDSICTGYVKWLSETDQYDSEHVAELNAFRSKWPCHEFWYI